MKKDFTTMISVVVCVLLVVNLIQIHHLKQDVTDLRAETRNELRAVSNSISSNVSSISENIRSAMEEERSLLTNGQGQCGEADIEKKTAEVICTIVPKEYTPGSTQVSILCNGKEWKLAYQDSEYTTKIEVPLFERSEVVQVKLNDHGTIRTQELDWVIEPRYGAVLNVYAGAGFSVGGSYHFMDTEDKTTQEPIDKSVKNVWTANARWGHRWGLYHLNVNLNGRIQEGRYSKTYYYDPAPGFSQWDLNTRHSFNLKSVVLEPGFGVENLFDKVDDRPWNSNYSTLNPGRSFYVSLSVRFN